MSDFTPSTEAGGKFTTRTVSEVSSDTTTVLSYSLWCVYCSVFSCNLSVRILSLISVIHRFCDFDVIATGTQTRKPQIQPQYKIPEKN